MDTNQSRAYVMPPGPTKQTGRILNPILWQIINVF
jgi:hypothetical protein